MGFKEWVKQQGQEFALKWRVLLAVAFMAIAAAVGFIGIIPWVVAAVVGWDIVPLTRKALKKNNTKR